ncbi:MAG TPA: VOC family protein [Phototrophicaceae bacterium]|nr:VOC family protein [Phototrophicaceae bacterium]
MNTGPVPVQGLFETHLTVRDLKRSITFYKDVIGLELGLEVPERNCAFFWIGESKHSMLGLWSIGTMPLGLVLHMAFEVTLNDLLSAPRRLRSNGVTPLSFFGQETDEPSALCWMPAASVFFRDPDGHLIEYLAMLNEAPKPALGIIPWSKWLDHRENR